MILRSIDERLGSTAERTPAPVRRGPMGSMAPV
jgi:hypothetical protein